MLQQSLEMGGAERQGLHLAQWLKEHHGVNLEVWGFGNSGSVATWCEDHNIPWKLVPWKWNGSAWTSLKGVLRLFFELKRSSPDILLPYTMPPNIVCGLLWRMTGAKNCIWNQRDEGRQRFSPRIERYAVNNTPWFVSNSAHAAKFLMQELGVDAGRIKVIHNGIELAPPLFSRSIWRNRLGISSEPVVACMVANLHAFKDHPTLLRAWRSVVDTSCSPQPILLLAGHDYGRREELENLATHLNLTDHIRFLGHVEDISGLLAASDIGVFSSLKEGVPNGVLECMAAGLPIVATDIPGTREALGHCNASFLVEPENPDAMSKMIIQLMNDQFLRQTIGEMNLGRVESEFSKESMCECYYRIIVRAINYSDETCTLEHR